MRRRPRRSWPYIYKADLSFLHFYNACSNTTGKFNSLRIEIQSARVWQNDHVTFVLRHSFGCFYVASKEEEEEEEEADRETVN